jgi:glycerophosphoryl diester phosphodiesterase
MAPYIFAHRGVSGYEIENTIPAFKRAIDLGVGIETDVQLTKDGKLICFHDPFLKIGSKYHILSNLSYSEIMNINFHDKRKIPLVRDVLQLQENNSDDLRFSIDILTRNAGIELLKLTEELSLLNKIEITDRRLIVLSQLRKHSHEVKLIYTLPINPSKSIINQLNISKLKKVDIKTINLQYTRHHEKNFKEIIENGLNCYVWGVNTKPSMKKIIELSHNNESVKAIYTDYPDILLNLIMEHFK